MLPSVLIGPSIRYRGSKDPDWLDYLSRIGDYASTIDHEFLAEICLEHGERFNTYFPGFDLELHRIQRRRVKASEIQQCVRYDCNELVDFYSKQFDGFREKPARFKYVIFEHMSEHGTWPFPPVIIDNTNGFAQSLSPYSLGRPWHLIEGTHRVSYLNRMLEIGLIEPTSEHEIFWLCQ